MNGGRLRGSGAFFVFGGGWCGKRGAQNGSVVSNRAPCRPAGMSSVRVECVVSGGYGIGESPVWDERESALLCVDITGRRVCRWSPGTGQVQAVPLGKALPGRYPLSSVR